MSFLFLSRKNSSLYKLYGAIITLIKKGAEMI